MQTNFLTLEWRWKLNSQTKRFDFENVISTYTQFTENILKQKYPLFFQALSQIGNPYYYIACSDPTWCSVSSLSFLLWLLGSHRLLSAPGLAIQLFPHLPWPRSFLQSYSLSHLSSSSEHLLGIALILLIVHLSPISPMCLIYRCISSASNGVWYIIGLNKCL